MWLSTWEFNALDGREHERCYEVRMIMSLVGWLVRGLVGWLVGWLVAWLVAWQC